MLYDSQRGVKTVDLWVETPEKNQNGSFFKIFNKSEKFLNVLEQSKSSKKMMIHSRDARK